MLVKTGSFLSLEPNFLTGCIKSLADKEAVVNNEERLLSDTLHVSTLLYDFCPRKKFLLKIFDKQVTYDRAKNITPAHIVMWEIGRAVENVIRRAVITCSKHIKPYGLWNCPCGMTQVSGLFDSKKHCLICSRPVDIYQEIEVHDKKFNIMGRPDLILFDGTEYTVVEIKSITKGQYEKLDHPIGMHCLQSFFYYTLLKRAGLKLSSKIIVIYCQKEFIYGTPFKEFELNAYDEKLSSQTNIIVKRAIDYQTSVKTGKSPLRVCKAITDRKAKNCPMKEICFAAIQYNSKGEKSGGIISRR